MECYFDNAATTRVYPEVVSLMTRIMLEDFGNPSAMHQKGVEAERYVTDGEKTLARILKVSEKEIFFTSGGTESNNLALIGGAMGQKRRGNRIVISAVEHPAVSAPVAFLKEQGFDVAVVKVHEDGRIDLDALDEALTDETILLSLMCVNNEVGSVMPLEEAGKLLRSKCPEALFHVDAIQGFGKMRLYPRKWGIDLLSVSGHKIHGPKGSGFLYIREGAKVIPQILGGGQMRGMRSGTLPVPGIAGLSLAAEMVYGHLDENVSHMARLKARLAGGLERIPDVVINGPEAADGAAHILSASFLGVRSEVLLHALEEKGIYISAGSACSSHKRKASPTLTAIGAGKERIESAVRFSFSEENTDEQVDECLNELEKLVPALRRFSRR